MEQLSKTLFQHIMQSPDVLAEMLVYKIFDYDGHEYWTSNVLTSDFETKPEAFTATLAKLKEVYNADES